MFQSYQTRRTYAEAFKYDGTFNSVISLATSDEANFQADFKQTGETGLLVLAGLDLDTMGNRVPRWSEAFPGDYVIRENGQYRLMGWE